MAQFTQFESYSRLARGEFLPMAKAGRLPSLISTNGLSVNGQLQKLSEAESGGFQKLSETYTVADAARILGLQERTLRNWIAAGKIRSVEPAPPARGIRIPAEVLRELGHRPVTESGAKFPKAPRPSSETGPGAAETFGPGAGDFGTASEESGTQWDSFPKTLASRSVAKAAQLRVFSRDRFTCRYCGRRTIFVPVLRVLSDLCPEQLPYHLNWKWTKCHPVYWTHSASCDHVIPVARGGTSEADNLATACYMCNSMKQNWLIEELGWNLSAPSSGHWDGLSGVYPALLCEHARLADAPYHRDWLRALTRTRA